MTRPSRAGFLYPLLSTKTDGGGVVRESGCTRDCELLLHKHRLLSLVESTFEGAGEWIDWFTRLVTRPTIEYH